MGVREEQFIRTSKPQLQKRPFEDEDSLPDEAFAPSAAPSIQ
jgi:hypothetical protein